MVALLNASSLRRLNPALLAQFRAGLTASQQSQLAPALTAERLAAQAMTDEEFWNWDRRYSTQVGLAAPTLVDLTEQGACGGGGCNPSYSNSQYWRANVACSPDVYALVLFQYRRYLAAQMRLSVLLNNPPQAWPGRMYFNDPQDADGCSTTLPMRPSSEQPLSTKANEWATWCIDVMRLVAVARWASGVRWSESTRGGADPSARGGFINAAAGGDDNWRGLWTTPDAYGSADPALVRPTTLREMGTVAACMGSNPTIIDVASSGSPQYYPDVALSYMAAYHPVGYYRPTSARGLSPARWTWGTPSTTPVGASGTPEQAARAFKSSRGLNEIGRSTLPEASVFQRFRTTDNRFPLVDMEFQGTTIPYYTGTWLQLSECLATRHGNASGPHEYVMPDSKSDFDPIVTPELIVAGTHVIWPDDFAQPTDTTPHGILVALFNQPTVVPSGLIDQATLSNLRAQWQLHWSSSAFRFMPAGLRQIWWCMGLAYDVVDTSMGTAVSQAFANFSTGLNQIPPAYRVLNPTEARDTGTGAARAQAQLDAVFAGLSAAAAAVGGVAAVVATAGPPGAIAGVVLGIVAGLVQAAAALAQNAVSLGIARAGNPPVMPTIMMRVAGTTDPTDPCWLVADARAGAGGASSLVPRSQAVATAAAANDDPSSWYAQVQQAIATPSDGTPPTTTATVNKGVALGAGAIAGLALIKLLGG